MNPDWRLHAACRGQDTGLFFPVVGVHADEAKAVCKRCPVRSECLEFALAFYDMEGIWGGFSERERRRIREKRKRMRGAA